MVRLLLFRSVLLGAALLAVSVLISVDPVAAQEAEAVEPPAPEGESIKEEPDAPPAQPKGGQTVEGVSVETNRALYVVGDSVQIALQNGRGTPIFLPGCGSFQIERFEGDRWRSLSGERCVSEGDALVISESSHLLDWEPSKALKGAILRVAITFGWGCEEGRVLSQARCEDFATVWTPKFSMGGRG